MTRSRSCLSKSYYHKKVLKNTVGFFGRRKNVFSVAVRAYIKSLIYSRRDHLKNHSVYKKYMIKNVRCWVGKLGYRYSLFMYMLRSKGILINVFMLYKMFNIMNRDNILCFIKYIGD